MSAADLSGQDPAPDHDPAPDSEREHRRQPAVADTAPHTDATGRARIDSCVTSGTFSLDGGTWEVENNVWIVGDDEQCVVIDPAHDPAAVVEAVGGRAVVAILLTHGH